MICVIKPCTKCGDEKPPSEFHKDDRNRDGLQSRCKVCCNAYLAASRKVASDNKKAENVAWLAENPKTAKTCPKCGETKPLNNFGKNSSKHDGLRVRCNVCGRSDTAAYKVKNPDKNANIQQRRRSSKLNATPAWANEFFISEAYHLAKLRKKATGIKWHVDHTVPLKSNRVCGLHVEHNLQVIPAAQNVRKGNRHWPDMPAGG